MQCIQQEQIIFRGPCYLFETRSVFCNWRCQRKSKHENRVRGYIWNLNCYGSILEIARVCNLNESISGSAVSCGTSKVYSTKLLHAEYTDNVRSVYSVINTSQHISDNKYAYNFLTKHGVLSWYVTCCSACPFLHHPEHDAAKPFCHG